MYVAQVNQQNASYSQTDSLYQGIISPTGFEVCRIIGYRNSFLPLIRGSFEPEAKGTAIHISMGLHPVVFGFLCVWYTTFCSGVLPFLLLEPSGLMLIIFLAPTLFILLVWLIFWFEVNRSSRELTQIILGDSAAMLFLGKRNRSKSQLKNLAILFAVGLSMAIGYFLVFSNDPKPIDSFQMLGEKVDLCTPKPTTANDCNYVLTFANSGHSQANVLAMSKDKQTLLSGGSDKALQVWDIPSGKLRKTLQSDSGEILAVAIDSNGKIAATGSKDRMARLWDLSSGKRLALLKGHTDEVVAVALRPSDHRLVSASSNGQIKIWDVDSGKLLESFNEHKEDMQIGPISIVNYRSSRFLSMSADGSTALILIDGNRLAVMNLFTGKITKYLEEGLQFFSSYINNAVISPHGEYGVVQHTIRASGRGRKRTETGKVNLWDLKTGKIVSTKTFTNSFINEMTMAINQGQVFGVDNGQMYIWDVKSHTTIANIKNVWIRQLIVSEDGKKFTGITNDDHPIKIWSKQ